MLAERFRLRQQTLPIPEETPAEERQRIIDARNDPDAFIEYVFEDDRGRPIRQAPQHRAWQKLWGSSDRHVLIAHAEAGKTTQLGARLTWELGRDPTQRILLLGATVDNPKKVLAVIRRAIGDPGEDGNERLRKVFPQLLPGHPWNSRELNLLGHVASAKDYSVSTAGLNTHIMGGRFDKIVADDLHNSKNSATETQRHNLQTRFDNEVQSRVTDRGSIWVLGNAWHRHDVPHTIGARPGWKFDRFGLLDERYRSRWPEQFSQARIAKLRATFGGLAFARMYLCIPLDDETQRFQQAWLDAAVERGRRVRAPWRPTVRPVDASGVALPTFTGVDFASGKSGRRRKTDQSSVFTWARWPNGDLQLIDLREGRWTAPRLVDELQEVQRLYDPIFWAEDNATQTLFIDLWRKDHSSPRVRTFTTGVNKYDPITGIEGLSIDAEAGRWIVPSVPSRIDPEKTEVPPEVAAWFQALLYYSPSDHPGDSVIGSWLATMAARLGASQMFFQENRALR